MQTGVQTGVCCNTFIKSAEVCLENPRKFKTLTRLSELFQSWQKSASFVLLLYVYSLEELSRKHVSGWL